MPADNCLITRLIYKANVTKDKDNKGKNYIELTEGTFKQRYMQQNHSATANMLTTPK